MGKFAGKRCRIWKVKTSKEILLRASEGIQLLPKTVQLLFKEILKKQEVEEKEKSKGKYTHHYSKKSTAQPEKRWRKKEIQLTQQERKAQMKVVLENYCVENVFKYCNCNRNYVCQWYTSYGKAFVKPNTINNINNDTHYMHSLIKSCLKKKTTFSNVYSNPNKKTVRFQKKKKKKNVVQKKKKKKKKK